MGALWGEDDRGFEVASFGIWLLALSPALGFFLLTVALT